MVAEHRSQDVTAHYRDDATLRSRSVSTTVLSGRLDVPAPTARLQADWRREIVRLGLEHGDVESLSLPRARTRWPDYRLCLQAMADWVASLGMAASFASSEVALMACIGTRYHHDAKHYGGLAFCNLFLGAEQALDLHFPALKLHIPLEIGSAVVFDTGQPHAVIVRDGSSGTPATVALGQDFSQMFLTWELPIHNPDVARGLGVRFDTDATAASQQRDEGVWVNGELALVCPDSGRWLSV
ncbi:MAG: hypothetical protein RIR09_1795 [Pseudomonadota bacterium]